MKYARRATEGPPSTAGQPALGDTVQRKRGRGRSGEWRRPWFSPRIKPIQRSPHVPQNVPGPRAGDEQENESRRHGGCQPSGTPPRIRATPRRATVRRRAYFTENRSCAAYPLDGWSQPPRIQIAEERCSHLTAITQTREIVRITGRGRTREKVNPHENLQIRLTRSELHAIVNGQASVTKRGDGPE